MAKNAVWGGLVLMLLIGCGAAATSGGAGTGSDPANENGAGETHAAGATSACDAHVEEALGHLDRGAPLAAERSLMRAARADRGCVAAYLNLAIVQRQTERLDEARANVRRALAIDATNVHAFHQLVLVHLAEARTDVGALELASLACRQGAQIDASFAPLHNSCGVVDVDRGRIVEALARFERAYTLDPTLYEAWMNFGQITLSFRGYEDAERAFRGALEAEPNDYDALIGLGVAVRGLGRMDAAREHYEQARAVSPDRPEAWYNLGILYQDHLDGQPEQLSRAEAYYETFVSKAHGDPEYAEAVDEVLRCCPVTRNGRAPRECRPGRLQNLRRAIGALGGRDTSGC